MARLFESYLASFLLAGLVALLVLGLVKLLRSRVDAGNMLRAQRIVFAGISVTAVAAPLLAWLLPGLATIAGSGTLAQAWVMIPLRFELATAGSPSEVAMSPGMRLPIVAMLLWLVGSGLVIASLCREMLHFRRLAANGAPVDVDALPVPVPPNVRVMSSASCASAFVIGVSRPIIFLPAELVQSDDAFGSDDRLAAVLLHELAHLENRDTTWLPACRLLLGFAWPVIPLWFLYRDLVLQAELAADAVALRGTGLAERRRYAANLVKAMAGSGHRQPTSLPTFSSRQLRRARMRIRNILNTGKTTTTHLRSRLARGLAVLLMLPLTCIQVAAAAGMVEIIFASPLASGELTSSYGERRNPFTGETAHHNGVDIKAPLGTPILAPAKGEVIFAGIKNSRYGKVVEIRHPGGFRTLYAHLQSTDLEVGDKVDEGMEIARVGVSGQSTGPHVHVELFRDGKRIDPMRYMPLREPAPATEM